LVAVVCVMALLMNVAQLILLVFTNVTASTILKDQGVIGAKMAMSKRNGGEELELTNFNVKVYIFVFDQIFVIENFV